MDEASGPGKDEMLGLRDILRDARAEAAGDAEGFRALIAAIENVARALTRTDKTLGRLRPPLMASLPELGGRNGFADLFEVVKSARNKAVHTGAWARHLTTNCARLALEMEGALVERVRGMANGVGPVELVMVTEPVIAQSWDTIDAVRRRMLLNSFSFLPYFDQRTESWALISDHAIAEFLLDSPSVHAQMRIRDAVAGGPGVRQLRLTAPVQPLRPGATMSDALSATRSAPALVVELDGAHQRLVGIVTAFDLL